jgi:hypothetical protein
MVTFGIKEDPPLVALQGGYSTPSQTSPQEGLIPSRAASMMGSYKTPSGGEIRGQEKKLRLSAGQHFSLSACQLVVFAEG